MNAVHERTKPGWPIWGSGSSSFGRLAQFRGGVDSQERTGVGDGKKSVGVLTDLVLCGRIAFQQAYRFVEPCKYYVAW
jgi:hypothetical protein